MDPYNDQPIIFTEQDTQFSNIVVSQQETLVPEPQKPKTDTLKIEKTPRRSRSPRRRGAEKIVPKETPRERSSSPYSSSHLQVDQTIRARSKSPMWFPGSTTYAEVLRGQYRQSEERETTPEEQSTVLIKKTQQNAELEKANVKQQPIEYNESKPIEPQNLVPVTQINYETPIITEAQQNWAQYQQTQFNYQPTITHSTEFYQRNIPQTNILEYISPPMPDMVNFIASGQQLISSGLGTYHNTQFQNVYPQEHEIYSGSSQYIPREEFVSHHQATYEPIAEIREPVVKEVVSVTETAAVKPEISAANAQFSYAQILSQGLSAKPVQPSSATVQQRPAPRQKSPVYGNQAIQQDETLPNKMERTRNIKKESPIKETIPNVVEKQHNRQYKKMKRNQRPDNDIQEQIYQGELTYVGGNEVHEAKDLILNVDVDLSNPNTDKVNIKTEKSKISKIQDDNTTKEKDIYNDEQNTQAEEKLKKKKKSRNQKIDKDNVPIIKEETLPQAQEPIKKKSKNKKIKPDDSTLLEENIIQTEQDTFASKEKKNKNKTKNAKITPDIKETIIEAVPSVPKSNKQKNKSEPPENKQIVEEAQPDVKVDLQENSQIVISTEESTSNEKVEINLSSDKVEDNKSDEKVVKSKSKKKKE